MKTKVRKSNNRKIVSVFLCLLIVILYTQQGIAQRADKRQASCYEISFSTNYLHYTVQKEIRPQDIDSVKDIRFTGKAGLGFGVLKNFEISSGVLIRTGIQAQLHKNNAGYSLLKGEKSININTISCSVPVSFIYLLNNKNKKPVIAKPYPLIGAKYTFVSVLGGKQNIYFSTNDVMMDLGLGVHLYSKKKHVVAVEFIFSNGFLNVKDKSADDIYNRAINKLFRQTYMFSINIS